MQTILVCIGILAAFMFFTVTFVYAELVAHWPVDEGSGKEIEDIVGKGGKICRLSWEISRFMGADKVAQISINSPFSAPLRS